MTNSSEMPPNPFSFTHFRKSASVTPLVSHSFKTKDLKPFRFTHLQKSGGGSPHLATVVIPSEPAIFAGDEGSQRSESREPHPANHNSPVTNTESLRLTPLASTLAKFAPATPLDSALTLKRASKSFTSNTYEKHTGGRGVYVKCGGSTPPCPGQQWGQGRIFQHPTSNFQPPPLDAKLSHQLQLR